jgi:hypothetical protein
MDLLPSWARSASCVNRFRIGVFLTKTAKSKVLPTEEGGCPNQLGCLTCALFHSKVNNRLTI